jgi:hypothetical protein
MSGGSFDHQNYLLVDMADTIDAYADRCAKGKPDEYGCCPRAAEKTLHKLYTTANELRALERKLHLIDYWMAGDICEDDVNSRWAGTESVETKKGEGHG